MGRRSGLLQTWLLALIAFVAIMPRAVTPAGVMLAQSDDGLFEIQLCSASSAEARSIWIDPETGAPRPAPTGETPQDASSSPCAFALSAAAVLNAVAFRTRVFEARSIASVGPPMSPLAVTLASPPPPSHGPPIRV